MKKILTYCSIALLGVASVYLAATSEPKSGLYNPRSGSVLTSNGNIANQALLERLMRVNGFTKEDYIRGLQQMREMGGNRSHLIWFDQGPDNVGGRTRAICIDKNDVNHLWAGSVSGGLFESFDRANGWQKVTVFNDNISISSICQTDDGTLWVATGHQREQVNGYEESGGNGDGVWYDDGTGVFVQVPGTSTFSYINEVRADTINNKIWIATNQGLKTYTPGATDVTDIDGGISTGACNSLSISPDGQVIVAGMGTNTNVSTDYGVTFTDVSVAGGATTLPLNETANRMEYAISHEKTGGNYQVYASCANGNLLGVWRSTDSGMNWTEIAPATTGDPGSFDPFTSGGSGQGTYDNIISVVPDNGNRCFLGGIDCYTWAYAANWEQVSQWFLSIVSPEFVHADQHEMVWDQLGRLYIGNDGGVFFSDDAKSSANPSFYAANRGYNVTQFYEMSFSAHGDVVGGAQDNGVNANYHTNSTWREHKEIGGGDGFGVELSFINRNIIFGTVYFSSLYRSSDRGENVSGFVPDQMEAEGNCTAGSTTDGCGQFHTRTALWENPNDLNSKDSVSYIPDQSYLAGETVLVPSKTSQVYMEYITPTDVIFDDTLDFDPSETTQDTIITTAVPSSSYNLSVVEYYDSVGGPVVSVGDSIYLPALDTLVYVLSIDFEDHYWGTNPLDPGDIYDMGNETQVYNVAWDTLKVQDTYQSWFALGGNSGEVYMTRNALRFSSNADWIKAIDSPSIAGITCMEFSRSGQYLWIGTGSGTLYRLSGFDTVYTPGPVYPQANRDSLIDWDKGHYATTLFNTTSSFAGRPILGISCGGNGTSPDDDHVLVACGGSGGMYESNNGSGAAPTFSALSTAPDVPSQPFFSCVIDRDDPNIMLIGGEFGVFLTEDGGSNWESANGDFGPVPVYDMGQNWRSYDEGCIKPGAIYIGTFGRGIWSTDEYLGVPGQDNLDKNKYIPNILVYPNPMGEQGNISFDLESNGDAVVHIFNLRGEMVHTFTEKNLIAGKNNIQFSAAGLSSGTYIVRLDTGNKTETAKFIKH